MLRIQATIGVTTYYFASEALDYADRYWEPRISNAFQLTREFNSADKSGNKIRTVDVSLDNRDGFFNSIYTADGLVNGKFVLYFNEGDNNVKTFTGRVNKINSFGDDVSLTIREVGYEYLTRKFPDAQIAYDYYSTSGINESWNAIPIHLGTVNRYPCPWVNLFYSHFIIGSGPIHAVKKIYFDKTVVYDSSTGQNGYKPTPDSPEIKFRVFKGARAGDTDIVEGVESSYPGFAYIQLYKIVDAVEQPADPINPDGEAVQIYVDIEGLQNEAGNAPERNPAQILYQFFTKPYTAEEGYGLAISPDDLDFSAAITECGIQGFKIDGSIDNTTDFGEWIDEILRCCRGQLYETGGKISVRIDAAAASPTIHFDETGELGYNCIVDTWNEPERDAQTNRVRLSYSWNFENSNFNKKPSYNQESPLGDTHLQNLTHANRIQKWNTETLEYKLIKDDTTAHKLAQYYLNNIVKQLITTSLTTEVDIPNTVDAGTVVKVTSPKFGWSEKLFRITSISRAEENTEIKLKEYDASIFTFIDPGTGAETSGSQYSAYNIPAKPELTSLSVVNELLADGSTQTRINVNFVAPTENSQLVALYYKPAGGTEADFKPLDTVLSSAGTMSAIWKGIESGNYNFRLVTVSPVGIYSDLSIVSGDKHYYGQPGSEGTVALTGDTIAPGKPIIDDFLLVQGAVTLHFNIPTGFPSDFSHFAVYRKLDGGSLLPLDMKYTGRLFTDTDTAGYVSRQYSIVAYDKSNNPSESSDLTVALTPLKVMSDDITDQPIIGKCFLTGTLVGVGNPGIKFDCTGIYGYSATANTFQLNAASGDVSMTGTITALAGNIGGFTIDPLEGLHAGCTTTRVQMKPGAGFWAGATAIGDAPFSVTQAGVLKSTSGTIGGFSIGTNILCSTPAAGCSVGMSACNTSGAVAFWAGCSTVGSAPFRVTNLGALTAISGTIGGWTLAAASLSATNAYLYSGAANTARLEMGTGACSAGINSANAGTDISFWAGSTFANRATAPFRITAAGVLTATNANITGAITATSGTFTGTVCACAGCIAGFSITNAAGIYSGSAATRIQMLAGTGLWLGADAFASAPFRVTPAGVLTATSGLIGGFSITQKHLNAGAMTLSACLDCTWGGGMIVGSSVPHIGTYYSHDGSVDNRMYLTFGQVWSSNNLTTRYGFGFTPSKGSTPYFEMSRDLISGTLTAQIAGWNFNTTQLYSTSCGLILNAAGSIQTGDFVTSNKGWKIDSVGNAEFNNICARGAIRTAVFIKDQISVIGGCAMIRPAAVICQYNLACTNHSFYVENTDEFAVGDIIRAKDGSGNEYWGTINAKGSYWFNTNYNAGTTGWALEKGQAVVNYGSCLGCGGIMLNGQCPYIDLYTHCGLPWLGTDSRVRIGNLDGWGSFSGATYGIAAGCPTGQYMTYDSVSGVLDIAGNINVKSTLPLVMPAGAVLEFSAKGSTTATIALAGGVKDVSGNSNHGQAFGGVTVVDTEVGKAFDFDGVSDYIATPVNLFSGTSSTNPASLSLFIKHDSTQAVTSGASVIFGQAYYSGFGLAVYCGRLRAFFRNSVNDLLSSEIGVQDAWQHIALVWGGQSDPKVYVYLNGALIQSLTVTYADFIYSLDSYPLSIGRAYSGGGSVFTTLKGQVAHPKAFGRALTAEEVKTLYMLGNQQESGVITADRVQTGVLRSLNWNGTTLGSCISMNDGTFKFGGESAPKLSWNGTTLNVVGNVTITGGSGIGNFTDAGALATVDNLDGVADGSTYKRTTQNEKTGAGRAYSGLDASNRLITAVIPGTAVTPSTAGLFIGSTNMGYHNGTVWKTYMDNTGNFYLGGSAAGCGLAWNATTNCLTVCGCITSCAGKIGGWNITSDRFMKCGATAAQYVLIGGSGCPTIHIAGCSSSGATYHTLGGCLFNGTWLNDRWGMVLRVGGNNLFQVHSCIDGVTCFCAQIAGWNFNANCLYSNNILINSNGSIYSNNYAAGSAGWCINGAGSAEFNNVTVRGTVCANSGRIGCFDISNGYLDFNSSRSIIASNYLCFGYAGCCSQVLLGYNRFCFEYNHDQTFNHLAFCKEIGVCFHGELFGTERTMAEVIVNPKNTGATTEEAILKICIGHTANPYAICTNGQIQSSYTYSTVCSYSPVVCATTCVRAPYILSTGRIEASRLGFVGTYNSAQTQGIWSMGSSYMPNSTTTGFGTLYGMGYSYSTVGGGYFSGHHQVHWVLNGTVNASMSLSGYLWVRNYILSACVLGTTCVCGAVTCGTTCVISPVVCGTTCLTSPVATITGSNMGTTTPTRIYASNNNDINYYTITNFKSVLGMDSGGKLAAWVNFNGSGTVSIRGSCGVSSIVDCGTGYYRVNFSTAMSSANYAAVGTAGPSPAYLNFPYNTSAYATTYYLVGTGSYSAMSDACFVALAFII